MSIIESFTDSALRTGFSTYCRCRGYLASPVNSDPRRHRHRELVQEIFYESGYFDSPDTPLADDPAGADCHSILVEHQRRAVGAVTTIKTPDNLPVEEYFNVRIPDDVERGQLAELTRFVIRKEHRRQDPVVSIRLLNAALNYSRRNQIRWWIWCAPSMFIWGFQAYFQSARILEQLPLTDLQIGKRKGREAYFSMGRNIRVVLVDLNTISVTQSAKEMLRRRQLRSKRK